MLLKTLPISLLMVAAGAPQSPHTESSASSSLQGLSASSAAGPAEYVVSLYQYNGADEDVFKFSEKGHKYKSNKIGVKFAPGDRGMRMVRKKDSGKIFFQSLDEPNADAILQSPSYEAIMDVGVMRNEEGLDTVNIKRGNMEDTLYRVARPGEEVVLAEDQRLKCGNMQMRVHEIYTGREPKDLKALGSAGGVTSYALSTEELNERAQRIWNEMNERIRPAEPKAVECYICMCGKDDEDQPLINPCGCPDRVAHPECLKHWRSRQVSTAHSAELVRLSDTLTAKMKAGCDVCLSQLPIYAGIPSDTECSTNYALRQKRQAEMKNTKMDPSLRPECTEFVSLLPEQPNARAGSNRIAGPYICLETICPQNSKHPRVSSMVACFPDRRLAAEIQRLNGGSGRRAQLVFSGGEDLEPVHAKLRLRRAEGTQPTTFSIQDKGTAHGTLVEAPAEARIVLKNPQAEASSSSMFGSMFGRPKSGSSKINSSIYYRFGNMLVVIRREN